MLPIASLLPGESTRLGGIEQPHVVRLTEVDGSLPPILVDRPTLRVIDGMHRLLAALLQGRTEIEVEFFDGTPAEAFLRAVSANVVHGLPLSQADRRAAAKRITISHPQMSDREIARASGLGAKTVAGIRRELNDVLPQSDTRVGRDGRVRPVSSKEGRIRAAEVLAERPDASLRDVARIAGISPATVTDVRRRLQAGQGPVLTPVPSAGRPEADPARPGSSRAQRSGPDPVQVLEKLVRDPALRHKEEGRHLLRILQQNAIRSEEWADLAASVPTHCRFLVVNLAKQYASTWMEFARELEDVILPGGVAGTTALAGRRI